MPALRDIATPLSVSIVIPAHGREESLHGVLRAIQHNSSAPSFEVIVVDDGSEPPLRLPTDLTIPVRLLRTDGRGPAAARNLGASAATGSILMFTDDDTIPSTSWVRAAVSHLDANPGHVGVDGPVSSRPWDRLYEKSIATEAPGHHWTCNVAYRRSAFIAAGGFREDIFAFAHGEDLELARRLESMGPIGFASGMRIQHLPRHIGLRDFARAGRSTRSALALSAVGGHPRHRAGVLGHPRVRLVIWQARYWRRIARSEFRTPRLRRLLRLAAAASLSMASTCWASAVSHPRATSRPTAPAR